MMRVGYVSLSTLGCPFLVCSHRAATTAYSMVEKICVGMQIELARMIQTIVDVGWIAPLHASAPQDLQK